MIIAINQLFVMCGSLNLLIHNRVSDERHLLKLSQSCHKDPEHTEKISVFMGMWSK